MKVHTYHHNDFFSDGAKTKRTIHIPGHGSRESREGMDGADAIQEETLKSPATYTIEGLFQYSFFPVEACSCQGWSIDQHIQFQKNSALSRALRSAQQNDNLCVIVQHMQQWWGEVFRQKLSRACLKGRDQIRVMQIWLTWQRGFPSNTL